jgi:CRISPR-associated protein Cas1
MQQWCSFWFDPAARLAAAKALQRRRIAVIKAAHSKKFGATFSQLALNEYGDQVEGAASNDSLLLAEARFTKALYRQLSVHFDLLFTREPRRGDRHNNALDASNYLAYGLAASALWVLGISFAMGVNHGQTRRGALVFDVADVVKDALVLPTVFESIAVNEDESKTRHRVLTALDDAHALKEMLDAVIATASACATDHGRLAQSPTGAAS